MMYFTQEQYETLKYEIKRRSEESKIWNKDGKRKAKYKKNHTAMSYEECEKYCEFYLSDNMRELNLIINKVLAKIRNEKEYFDERERYELKDLAYEVFVLSLGTYDPKAECSFKTFLYGNIFRKSTTYGRDRTRMSRCNCEPKWDKENKCYALNKRGEIDMRPVFDISMYSVIKKDGNEKEIWQDFKAKDNVENTVIEKQIPLEEYSDSVKAFLENMSRDARNVATYILDGYTKETIIKCKGVTTEQYNNAIREFRTFENVHILLGGQCNAKN